MLPKKIWSTTYDDLINPQVVIDQNSLHFSLSAYCEFGGQHMDDVIKY